MGLILAVSVVTSRGQDPSLGDGNSPEKSKSAASQGPWAELGSGQACPMGNGAGMGFRGGRASESTREGAKETQGTSTSESQRACGRSCQLDEGKSSGEACQGPACGRCCGRGASAAVQGKPAELCSTCSKGGECEKCGKTQGAGKRVHAQLCDGEGCQAAANPCEGQSAQTRMSCAVSGQGGRCQQGAPARQGRQAGRGGFRYRGGRSGS